jgi:hypothetical protein
MQARVQDVMPEMGQQNEADMVPVEEAIGKPACMTTEVETPIAPISDCLYDTADEYDSDGTDIVGDMSRGMIRPPDFLNDEQSDQEDEQDVEPDSDQVHITQDLNGEPEVSQARARVPEQDHRPFALSRSQVVSLVVHDMAVKYKASRSYVQDQRRLHAALGTTILDYRTVRRRVCNMTAIEDVRYDCCPNSCMSYAMFPDLDTCLEPECQHPRWKDVERKVPYAQHSYIPITQRLLLWWSNSARAKSMLDYRTNISDNRIASRERLDFWTGTLFHQLRDQGLFAEKTDLAFTLSSDGVKVSHVLLSLRIIHTQITMAGVQK